MKVAFLLVLAFAAVMALTDQEKEEFKAAGAKCNADPATAIVKEEVEKWRKDGGPLPANMGPHELCMSKALGWQDANGKLLKDELKAKLIAHAPADKVDKLIKDCLIEEDDEVATARHLFKCFFE